jgi:DNA-binding MarR family transcriptional regulator
MASGEKQRLLAELSDEIRAGQVATDMVDQAIADLLGLNRTDLRCLDILDRLGTITAGRLAEESKLTTGAVTAVIDRLEKSGYVRRVRDEHDRRRVLVEMTPEARRGAAEQYQPIIDEWARMSKRLTIDEIKFLLDFTRRGRMMNLDLAEDLHRKLAEREARAKRRGRGQARR